jgi:hypothetical protein
MRRGTRNATTVEAADDCAHQVRDDRRERDRAQLRGVTWQTKIWSRCATATPPRGRRSSRSRHRRLAATAFVIDSMKHARR